MKSKYLQKRVKRHKRARAKIKGTSRRLRLCVYRSAKHLQIQLIDDSRARTLWGVSDHALLQKGAKKGTKQERAERLGKLTAKKILELGVTKIVFDRGGYAYHGRVKAFAETLRKEGIEF
jgi:large subunit ribosomal protein L18